MKKLTSALALVAVAASLVACNKPEEKKPEVKVEAPKVVEETKTTTTSTTTTAPMGRDGLHDLHDHHDHDVLCARHEVSEELPGTTRRPGDAGAFSFSGTLLARINATEEPMKTFVPFRSLPCRGARAAGNVRPRGHDLVDGFVPSGRAHQRRHGRLSNRRHDLQSGSVPLRGRRSVLHGGRPRRNGELPRTAFPAISGRVPR